MKKNRAGSVTKYLTKTGTRLWRFQFDAEPKDGKRRLIGKAGFSKRADALKALYAAVEEYETSKREPTTTAPAPPPKETLAGWMERWFLDYAPQRCQPKTLERYRQLAAYILEATDGDPARLATTPLESLTHGVVEAGLYSLLRMPAKRREHLSTKTVREVAGVLSVALNKAFRLGKIDVNPLLRVELPRVDPKRARSLTPEEIQRLRETCRSDWTFTFIEVALATGARRGELLALTWPDLDWLSGIVTISKSLEQTANGLRVKTPKNGKTRRCKLGQTALTALRFQQNQQQEHRRLYASDYAAGDLIFCQPDGSFLWPHLVSQTIKRRMKKAGCPDACLHSTRHSHASNLLSKGVPLPAVSARLGHCDPNVTARIYSHALPADDERAVAAWEDVVKGPVQ